MKFLVIGLDCAAPEILLGDDTLTNIRSLMARGCYGRLESVVPPITVPAWMCMSTSQDPGSLGVYGFRNRTSHAYDALVTRETDDGPHEAGSADQRRHEPRVALADRTLDASRRELIAAAGGLPGNTNGSAMRIRSAFLTS